MYFEEENEEIRENRVEFFYMDTYKDKLPFFPHTHAAVEFLYIKDGKYKFCINDTEYSLKSGDLLLCRANSFHSAACIEGGGYFVVKIEPSLITDFSSRTDCAEYLLLLSVQGRESKTVWTHDELVQNGAYTFLESMTKRLGSDDLCLDIAVKADIMSFVVPILRDLKKTGLPANKKVTSLTLRSVYSAVSYINENYAKPLTAEECAKIGNMSISHFSRSFGAVTGKTFREYLNFVRINNAEKLLLTSEISVTEACFACGFDNPSYFIAVYKKQKGKTPHKTVKSAEGIYR